MLTSLRVLRAPKPFDVAADGKCPPPFAPIAFSVFDAPWFFFDEVRRNPNAFVVAGRDRAAERLLRRKA
jgi:hypothetical protein